MIELFASMQKKKDAHELAVYIGKTSGITKMLNADKSVEGMSRNENLQELFNSIQEFVDNKRELATEGLDTDASLGVYLQEVSLLTDMDKDDEEDSEGKVKMMTVHSAKGLEFSCVYIVGMEEGLFPSGMSKQPKEIEEERRLFYVAATRAEKKLFLSLAACRYRFGTLQYGEPSRFIGELNERHFKIVGQKPSFQPTERQNSNYNSFKDSIRNNINSVKRQQQQRKNLGKDFSKLLANFKPSDPRTIRQGMMVLHQRFGRGKVLSLDGKGDKTIAVIRFDVQGEKRILLRFAKLMVVS
jgi:DNA helicase-2/ATP-dependent DNA helicase PcrA